MSEQILIKRGFNNGYLIQKEKPELAIKIAAGFKNSNHPYAIGFMNGSIECIKELKQDVHQFIKLIDDHKNPTNSIDNDTEQEQEIN